MGIEDATCCQVPERGSDAIVCVRERILTIRLMEKMNANPAYAKAFGMAAQNGTAEAGRKTASDTAANQP